METCFGLRQTCICLTLLCSMLCVEGWSYYYSNATMNWESARAWCREHYTDMVAIQNRGEIDHLNSWLPWKAKYYWIGIRRVDDVWTWVGTNKALTTEATNWAEDEPNNGNNPHMEAASEDCVEMYIKREHETGKWNDEKCENMKTALCYTAACRNDSCHHGECVETINSHRCACFEGFYGETCDRVITCNKDEVTVPHKGGVNCTHPYGNFSYDSSCEYSCETGYQLTMSRPLRCTATKKWSEQPPQCEPVRCPELSTPDRGSVACSNPLGSSSYLSTCMFTCNEGFVLAGSQSDTLQCGALGNWNASQPSCIAAALPALQKLENGFVSCGKVDLRFVPTKSCNFSCASGYRLLGASSTTYTFRTTASQLSQTMPQCEAITCPSPEGDAQLIPTCSRSPPDLRPGSTYSFCCAAGFQLVGAETLQCSDDGRWNGSVPTCKAIECPAPQIPTNGHMSCGPSSSPMETSHPLGTSCSFSCDEGHDLEGARSVDCGLPGQWSSDPPTCTVVRCPELDAPEHGSINCSDSEPVHSSHCSFACGPDHALVGHKLLTCGPHGNWTEESPTCQVPPPQVSALVSGVASAGAVLSGLSLATWILKHLKQKKDTFELNSNSDIEIPNPVYRSSTENLLL